MLCFGRFLPHREVFTSFQGRPLPISCLVWSALILSKQPWHFSVQNKRLAHADLFNLKKFSFVKTFMGISLVKGSSCLNFFYFIKPLIVANALADKSNIFFFFASSLILQLSSKISRTVIVRPSNNYLIVGNLSSFYFLN